MPRPPWILLGALVLGAAIGAIASLLTAGAAEPLPAPTAVAFVPPAAPAPGPTELAAPAATPERRSAVASAPEEPAASAALRVTLTDPLFGEPPSSSFVTLVPASGDPPRSTDDVPREAPELERDEDGTFRLDALEAGDWFVLAGRAREGVLTARRVTKVDAPVVATVELPGELAPGLVELRIDGPVDALLGDATVSTTRSVAIPLLRASVDGSTKLWMSEEALRVGDKPVDRIVVTIDGLGSVCQAIDPTARVVVVEFAPACEVLVTTSGSEARDVLVDIRPDLSQSPDRFSRPPSLDGVATTAGRTVRFGGLQPGAYRVCVLSRPEYTRFSRAIRPPIAERTVTLDGSQAIDIALPVIQDLIVERTPKDDSRATITEVVARDGRSVPRTISADRYTGTLARFYDVPEGAYDLRASAASERAIRVYVPTSQMVVRTEERPR